MTDEICLLEDDYIQELKDENMSIDGVKYLNEILIKYANKLIKECLENGEEITLDKMIETIKKYSWNKEEAEQYCKNLEKTINEEDL